MILFKNDEIIDFWTAYRFFSVKNDYAKMLLNF